MLFFLLFEVYMVNTHINLGIQGSNLIVQVIGRATAEYCPELDSHLTEFFRCNKIERVFFESHEASYMDSSFIGIILSIKKKFCLKENSVFLLNPDKKITDIFELMGLETFIPSLFSEELDCSSCGYEINKKLENTISDIRLLLEAHRTIMETSKENHKRFALVEKMCLQELEKRLSH